MGLGPRAEIVSSQALLFEEFVAREAKAGRFALDLRAAGAAILLHGHAIRRRSLPSPRSSLCCA